MEVYHTIALSLALGILAYLLDRRFRIPAIIFLLSFGLISGPTFLHVLHPDSLGSGLIVFVEIAVALILFEGGISLSSSGFKIETVAIHRLLIGTLTLTGAGATVLAHLILKISWQYSFLFGAIIIVTGPTVMGAILRNVNLLPRLEMLLHWESIWGDVAGAVVSAVALELLIHADSAFHILITFMVRIFSGIGVGVVAGYILRKFIFPFAEKLHDDILPGLLASGSAIGVFSVANLIMEGSGPLAAVVTGLMLTRLPSRILREVRHFNELMIVLFIGMLFVLLSARVNLELLRPYWFKIAVVAIVLGAFIRPLAVFVSLYKSTVTFREQLYIGMIGPRGILAMASVAYAAILLKKPSVEVEILSSTVFTIILLSGIFTTLLCKPLSKILKVDSPPEKLGILIVGLNELSIAIADFIKTYIPVAFLDTNESSCRLISKEGFTALCADVVDETIYEEAIQVGYGRLLILTPDDALNELIALKGRFHFGTSNVFKAKGSTEENLLLVEPVARFLPAFSDKLIVSEVLKAIRKGRATFKVCSVEEINSPQGTFLIPLVDVDEQNKSVHIFIPDYKPRGKVLCLNIEGG